MPLTRRQTLGPGDTLSTGTLSSYRAVAARPGEEHVIRTELLGEPDPPPAGDLPAFAAGGQRAIACVAHMTDLHVGDVQSPARFEFFNREFRDPRFAGLIPTQRPQEALTAHALDALVRTLNGGLAGPLTGATPELVLGRRRQRPAQRGAHAAAPARRWSGQSQLGRTRLRGRAVPRLARRHLLGAGRKAGCTRPLCPRAWLPRPPGTAPTCSSALRGARTSPSLARLSRQPRQPLPGRRADDARPTGCCHRAAQADRPTRGIRS